MKVMNGDDLEKLAAEQLAEKAAGINAHGLARNSSATIRGSNRTMTLDIETVPLEPEYLERYGELFPRRIKTIDGMRTPASSMAFSEMTDSEVAALVGRHIEFYPNDLDEPALHWTTGRIACFGLKMDDDEPICIIKQDEADILREAWEILTIGSRGGYLGPWTFCTFNGKKFDFPFIINRANALRVMFGLPTDWKRHIDLFDHPHVGGKWGVTVPSLARMAFVYGVSDSLYGDGKSCSSWWEKKEWSEIAKHSAGDLNTTYRLLQRGFWG